MNLKPLTELIPNWHIKSKGLLLGPALATQTPESFIEYVKSLFVKSDSKGSKTVDGVTLTFGKRSIIRIKREPKLLTREEVRLLAEEHEQDELELLSLFHSRKVGITYAEDDERKSAEAHLFKQKEKKPRKKRVLKEQKESAHKDGNQSASAGNTNST